MIAGRQLVGLVWETLVIGNDAPRFTGELARADLARRVAAGVGCQVDIAIAVVYQCVLNAVGIYGGDQRKARVIVQTDLVPDRFKNRVDLAWVEGRWTLSWPNRTWMQRCTSKRMKFICDGWV